MSSAGTNAPAVAVAPRGYRRRSRWRHFAIQSAPLLLAWIILALTIVAWIVFYYRKLDRFPGSFDWLSVLNTSMPLVFAAVGQTVVVITRGLDLSIGGMISVSVSLAATHMGAGAGDMILWTVLILLAGAAGGLLNGLLVAYARLQPILVTLATLSIYQGIAIKILPQPGGRIPQGYTNALANPNQPTALIFVGLTLALWFAFRRSGFGVSVYALGNDEDAALASGIAVRRTKVLAYVVSGVFAAAAGLFLGATTTAGDATGGDVYVLTSIAAVVLGGISFYGGRGSAVGSICGAFALTLVVNVLFFAHIDPLYQSFYQGLFLIVAVVLGTLVGRLARGRR
jgi:ribose transport system permease protein